MPEIQQVLIASRELITDENLDVCGSIWRSSGGDAFAEVGAIKAFRAANNICGWIGTWHPKQNAAFLRAAFDRTIASINVSDGSRCKSCAAQRTAEMARISYPFTCDFCHSPASSPRKCKPGIKRSCGAAECDRQRIKLSNSRRTR